MPKILWPELQAPEIRKQMNIRKYWMKLLNGSLSIDYFKHKRKKERKKEKQKNKQDIDLFDVRNNKDLDSYVFWLPLLIQSRGKTITFNFFLHLASLVRYYPMQQGTKKHQN